MGYPFPIPNRDEEALNQQFAGFLHYSLQIGPDLLNRIHSDEGVRFSSDANVIAHQDSPLPQFTESGPNREIDWVVEDHDKLVGYESKYDDSLGARQLADELEKLHLNAQNQDVILFAVTPDSTEPSILNEFEDDPVYWLSWYTVSRRLQQTDEEEIAPEQRPILRMLQDLFEAEDMHPFTGFNHHDKQQYRYFIRDLRQELMDEKLENRGKTHTWATASTDPSSFERIIPKYIEVPFVRTLRMDSDTKRGSYLTATVDTETHEVYTGIVFNVREVEKHEDFVGDNVDTLVRLSEEREWEFWASMNSLNEWEVGVSKTDAPDEMRNWLANGRENEILVNDTSYKKAHLVTDVSSSEPPKIVRESIGQLLEFHELFLLADDIYSWPDLSEYDAG